VRASTSSTHESCPVSRRDAKRRPLLRRAFQKTSY
jgi:hypothetical protein